MNSRYSGSGISREEQKTLSQDAGLERLLDAAHGVVVVLSGLNEVSKKALLNRDLVLQSFPFKVGRFSPHLPFSSSPSDLLIAEEGSNFISERHLSIEKSNGDIFLKDERSQSGSLFNDKPFGKNGGGPHQIRLDRGKSKITLGGPSSPFVFQVRLMRGNEIRINPYYGSCMPELTPAETFYIRLCHYTKDLLRSEAYNDLDRVSRALDVAKCLAEDTDMVHNLYCYAAHPETFSDLVVAHSVNVAIYATKLFHGLSYPEEDIVQTGGAALLHDIGLQYVPAEILEKKEPISEDEHEVLKEHPLIGYERLSSESNEYDLVLSLILNHHERIDGSGYPGGFQKLPAVMELFALADFFEAVTHHRPQRGPLTPHMGMRMLLESERKKFSAKAIKSFIDFFSLFPAGSLVQLNSGEIGRVVKTNLHWPLRPVVRILVNSGGEPVKKKKQVNLIEDRVLYITKDLSQNALDDPVEGES